MVSRNDRRISKRKLSRMVDHNMATRQCDGCTACCTVMGVTELGKGNFIDCQHVVDRGCGIYGSHPKSCKDFVCMWRIGVGSDEQKPNLIGLVIDTTRPGHTFHPGLFIRELWDGAIEEQDEFVGNLASKMIVFLIQRTGPRRIIGPEDRMRSLMPHIERMKQELQEKRRSLPILPGQ
jgi:hypothetical protein